jgi:hypothetical protein
MNKPELSHPDAARTKRRTSVAQVEGEIARLAGPIPREDGTPPANGLRASWDRLVEQLALGPEPDVRECPACHHIGMRAASVCGYCWAALTPPS